MHHAHTRQHPTASVPSSGYGVDEIRQAVTTQGDTMPHLMRSCQDAIATAGADAYAHLRSVTAEQHSTDSLVRLSWLAAAAGDAQTHRDCWMRLCDSIVALGTGVCGDIHPRHRMDSLVNAISPALTSSVAIRHAMVYQRMDAVESLRSGPPFNDGLEHLIPFIQTVPAAAIAPGLRRALEAIGVPGQEAWLDDAARAATAIHDNCDDLPTIGVVGLLCAMRTRSQHHGNWGIAGPRNISGARLAISWTRDTPWHDALLPAAMRCYMEQPGHQTAGLIIALH